MTQRNLLFIVLALTSACSVPPALVRVPPPPAADARVSQTGIASWYGPGFHGKATASGDIYNQNDMTAAHQTLPLGAKVMVTNMENGRAAGVHIAYKGRVLRAKVVMSTLDPHSTFLDLVGEAEPSEDPLWRVAGIGLHA